MENLNSNEVNQVSGGANYAEVGAVIGNQVAGKTGEAIGARIGNWFDNLLK
jgi:uncharacterized protein YcfJ